MNNQDGKRPGIAVIGAGPGGMQAALAAAKFGAEVTLIDAHEQPGGHYYKQLPRLFQREAIDRHQAEAASFFARLDSPQITIQPQTQVLGISENGRNLWLHGPLGLSEMKTAAVVLATGAYDRPAAFPGWTLPGVMALGAAQTAIKGQRAVPGRKLLLAGTGPLLLATGAALTWAGARVVGIIEGSTAFRRVPLRQWGALWGQWPRLREGGRYLLALRRARVPYQRGWGVVEALGTPATGVTGAVIAPLDERWQPLMPQARQVKCDTICIGYGFIPETALSRLAGAAHTFQTELGGWVPVRDAFMETSIPGVFAAGDGAGIGGAVQAALEGQIAGAAAARHVHQPSHDSGLIRQIQQTTRQWEQQRAFQRLYGPLFTPGKGIHSWSQTDTLLCRCENVTQAKVATAVGQGAHSVTAVKGLTRAGMGSCQGRLCSHLIAGQVARLTGKPIAACGQLSARAPIHPVPINDVALKRDRS